MGYLGRHHISDTDVFESASGGGEYAVVSWRESVAA
jgi:hypothetical protein